MKREAEAIVSMMVFWFSTTRKDLRKELLECKNDGEWRHSGIIDFLGEDKFIEIRESINRLAENEDFKKAWESLHDTADKFWTGPPTCPPITVIVPMVNWVVRNYSRFERA